MRDRIRFRLAALLSKQMSEQEGIPIDIDCDRDMWIQQGGYRHVHWDLARWGADFHASGRYFSVYSWDTMTDCVRYGLTVDKRRDVGEREVSSNKP